MGNDPQGDTDAAAEHVTPKTGRSRRGVLGLIGGAFGLARRSQELALDLAKSGVHKIETRALSTLKRKLNEVGRERPPTRRAAPAYDRSAPSTGSEDPAQTLHEMLQVAIEQSQEDARLDLNRSLLRQLVADEVRLLSAMADGSGYAMCHLGAGPMVGPASHRLLENLSVVGRAAGVRLTDATPYYVKHLRDLGLVESGPEDPAQNTKYQLLETETALRKAVEHIEKVLKLKPRIFRHTIRMSAFGKQFWDSCNPTED